MPLADRALVVGINQYPGISVLQGAENDAQDFHAWVTDQNGGGVDPANARLLVSSQFEASAVTDDAQPAKEQIEKFFIQVDNAAVANNNDNLGSKAGKRLWLFFSGHGFAPSLDKSAVLAANATRRLIHNIAAMMWADRLYEGGWFDEVILFQDACRAPITFADLAPPFLLPRTAPSGQTRRRFYAFSAKNRKLSKELPLNGSVHGVFTATLMEGLRGAAADPKTGAVTTAQLKAYLQDNMQKLLPAADLLDDDVAKEPEVFDPDHFVVVDAKPGQAVAQFPVSIAIASSGAPVRIEDGSLQTEQQQASAPALWNLNLPRGLYRVVITDGPDATFKVTGALLPDGTKAVTNVSL